MTTYVAQQTTLRSGTVLYRHYDVEVGPDGAGAISYRQACENQALVQASCPEETAHFSTPRIS